MPRAVGGEGTARASRWPEHSGDQDEMQVWPRGGLAGRRLLVPPMGREVPAMEGLAALPLNPSSAAHTLATSQYPTGPEGDAATWQIPYLGVKSVEELSAAGNHLLIDTVHRTFI